MPTPWPQTYDPLGNVFWSTLIAAIPVVVLLGSIAFFKIRIHYAALLGLGAALAIALFAYGMPSAAVAGASLYGAAFGLFPIGWIILNLLFLYELTVRRGLFDSLRRSLASIAPDPRVQIILIAFCFGAFFEGAAGFGTPVAVTGAILVQLGFRPLHACGLSLIANTAPVAFGALGTPIITLASVTGIDPMLLSQMAGRQLPFFSLIVPFWCVAAFCGWRRMLAVWPAALTAGVAFAIPQYLVSNFIGPELVDIISSLVSIAAVVGLLKVWKPSDGWVSDQITPEKKDPAVLTPARTGFKPWMPWIVLSVVVLAWGYQPMKDGIDKISTKSYPVPGLHLQVQRTPPVAPPPKAGELPANEKAEFKLNLVSATGTGILVAALLVGIFLRFRPRELVDSYVRTLWKARFSLLTIAAMLALGYLTKYCGADATLGLALAGTGILYPFFGTMLGWLGVALTGSDTASNVLFGGLQKITSEQLGLNPVLMCTANSTGGVMGEIIDAQSIVVASTATESYGQEGAILRYVFFHSIILAALVGILVSLQASVPPFTHMVPAMPK